FVERIDVAGEQAGLAQDLQDAVGAQQGLLVLLVAGAPLAIGPQVDRPPAQGGGPTRVVRREGLRQGPDPAAHLWGGSQGVPLGRGWPGSRWRNSCGGRVVEAVPGGVELGQRPHERGLGEQVGGPVGGGRRSWRGEEFEGGGEVATAEEAA